MSKDPTAKVELSFLVRVLKASLLALALVCAAAPAGRAQTDADGGGVIAFAAGGEIFVQGVGGGPARKIVGRESGGENRQPAVSPDGMRVAFSSSRAGGYSLYVVGIDGAELRRLTYSPGGDGEPTWSPDGSKIAFVRGYDGTDGGYANMSTCPSQIYVVEVPGLHGGGRLASEFSLTHGQGGTDPAWSPDGTHIAFSSYRDGNYEIYTMDTVGGDIKRLTYTGAAEAEPAWSPDGGSIAYSAHLVGVVLGCGWMGTPLPPPPADESWPTVVPPPGVYVLSLNGGRPTSVRVSGVDAVTDPTWSPDGTRIAFVNVVSGDGQLYTVDVVSGLRTQLTFDPAPKSSPSWSNAGGSE
ncbi:MAG TPA: hypothetical protein VF297_06215 [Pyrinomonadaceae bacterium]